VLGLLYWFLDGIAGRVATLEAANHDTSVDLRLLRGKLENLSSMVSELRSNLSECGSNVQVVSGQLAVFEQQYRNDHADNHAAKPNLSVPAPPRRKSARA